MDQKKLLLLLLPLVVSCGTPVSSNEISSLEEPSSNSNTTSSEEEKNILDLESTLNDFKKGIKVSVEMKETRNGQEKNLYFQNTSKVKEFSFIQFKDETKQEKGIHEYYVSQENDEDDLVYLTRLNVSNSYTYYPVYNTVSTTNYTWSDGYNNAFLSLTVDSFAKVNDFTYTLKDELLSSKSDEFSTLFYGNPGLVLDALSLCKINDELVLTSSLSFEKNYVYQVEASVLQLGENVEMDYRLQPFEEVEDNLFSQMLASLKENNYTATIENYDDDFLDSTSVLYSENDKIYYETLGYKTGYYSLEDGTIQEVKKEDEDFYKVGSPREESLNRYRASFNISNTCFNKENNIYTLKNGVEGDISSIITLEGVLAEDLNDFTITIEDNSYTFSNIDGTDKTVVTFTDIGTTSVGFAEDSVLEPVATSSWSDVLTEDDYQLLVNLVGEDAAKDIPVPENCTDWVQASEETEDYLTFVAGASATIDDDFFAYYLTLMDLGYYINEEEMGENGGYVAAKEITVNGEPKVLAVEFLYDEYAFYIIVYFGE